MVEMVVALHRLAYSRQTLGAVWNEAIHAKRRRALQPWVLPIDLKHVPDCVLDHGRHGVNVRDWVTKARLNGLDLSCFLIGRKSKSSLSDAAGAK